MDNQQLEELKYMLAAVYQRLERIENKLYDKYKSAPLSSYYEELKKEATKIKESVENKQS